MRLGSGGKGDPVQGRGALLIMAAPLLILPNEEMKRSRKPSVESPPEKKTLASAAKDADPHLYRCPACGALVDSRDRGEMALHHRHVLFPR